MQINDLLKRVDELLIMGKAVIATGRATGGQYSVTQVSAAPMAGFRSAALSFIERTFESKHPYSSQFQTKTEQDYLSNCEAGVAILEAVRGEIAGGWMFSVKSLVTAEVFADFLSMAEHLLETGYKDPAAVIAGSVLEEHLRQLCGRHSLNTEEVKDGRTLPLKADRLNAELAKSDVYTKLDQKLITAWLDLRNNAAHGKYTMYTREQVQNMISGATEFMVRVSAK